MVQSRTDALALHSRQSPGMFVQGDDELGALAEIHRKIYEADVNVYSASGVTDGQGSFGYIVYIKSNDFEKAAAALAL